jgi:cytochrome c553
MKSAVFAAAVAALLALGQPISGHAENSVDLAVRNCALCHGPKGDSPSSAFPKLAGQQAAYIDAQLKAFRSQTRGDPGAQAYMWAMASRLDDAAIAGLAAYYAAQKAMVGTPADPALMAEGKKIYEQGIPEEKIIACFSCHGPDAKGQDTIPRLAGQHAPYLVKQLAYLKSQLRGNAPIMHAAIGEDMTLHQMEAVAGYVGAK